MRIESGRWAVGYYRINLSWIVLLKAPRFGMIHLSYPVWWKPLAMLPRAIIAHTRLVLSNRRG